MMPPITPLHTFGLSKEESLQKRLEEALEEPLVRTLARFSHMDFVGDTHYVELKSRQAPYLPDSFPTWLLPTCKKPKAFDKDTIFFYYFEKDDSLHYLFYDEELFGTFEKEKPYWHPTKQEHWLIPKEHWTKL